MKFTLIAAVWIAPFVCSAAEPLAWKFEVGQQLPYRVTQSMQMQLDAGDAGQLETTTEQTVDLVWIVERVEQDGAARMTQDVTRVQMAMKAPFGQKYALDTSTGEPPEGLAAILGPTVDALVQNDSTFTLSPAGEISEFELPPKLAEAIQRASESGAAMLNEDAVRSLAGRVALPLPSGGVDPGAEWKRQEAVSIPVFGQISIETIFTLANRNEEQAEVAIAMQVDAADIPEERVSARITSTEANGAAAFSINGGRVERINLERRHAIEIDSGEQTLTGTLDLTTTADYGPK